MNCKKCGRSLSKCIAEDGKAAPKDECAASATTRLSDAPSTEDIGSSVALRRSFGSGQYACDVIEDSKKVTIDPERRRRDGKLGSARGSCQNELLRS